MFERFTRNLDRLYLGGARAFGAAADFKFDFLTVFKLGVAICLDFGVVNEKIFASVFGGDESVAFFGIEPFYCSCTHILVFTCVIHKTRRLRALYM